MEKETFRSCDDIILNYEPLLSAKRKVKMSISENADKIRQLLKLNNYLKEKILNTSEKNLVLKGILTQLIKGKISKQKKILIINNINERNKNISEKNKKLKENINSINEKINDLNNILKNEIDEQLNELNILKDDLFILLNQINLKNNYIENYKEKIKNFNCIQERIREIYIDKTLKDQCDQYFLRQSISLQEKLQKELKDLNKVKQKITELINEKEIISSYTKLLNGPKNLISEKGIVWETERENDIENNSEEEKSIIFRDFELSSYSISECFDIENESPIKISPIFLHIPDKIHMESSNIKKKIIKEIKNNNSFEENNIINNNNGNNDSLNKKINAIPKLNLNQIQFNKNNKNIHNININLKKTTNSKKSKNNITSKSVENIKDNNNNTFNKSYYDYEEKIEDMKENIYNIKEKISKNKKLIKKFKKFCKQCMKTYDSSFLFESNYMITLNTDKYK